MSKGRYVILVLGSWCAAVWPTVSVAEDPALTLAVELAQEGDHHAAAVEFRRLALSDYPEPERGRYFWMAAYEYWRNEEPEPVPNILDRAETFAPDIYNDAMLLRAETALQERKDTEALFYLESVSASREADGMLREYATRRMAAVHLRRKDPAAALESLENGPGDYPAPIAAIDSYMCGKDKKPLVGGLLGIVPGLGYFYAGEWANGLRSIILNGIFIWGMVETAGEDQWGTFTVISFFELTWYTGSIYGGIDASHRYNRRRLDACVEAVEGQAFFAPEYHELPVLTLRFEF
ncbi:MAG: hypothetical protein EOM20_08940 [Spartobacteria bacterium]|nr:hypothetical protein [Spartobacteria bacterium]